MMTITVSLTNDLDDLDCALDDRASDRNDLRAGAAGPEASRGRISRPLTAPSRHFTVDELAKASGATRRSIHYWVRLGFLVRPELAGRRSLYEPGSLARIFAIRALRRVEKLPVAAVRRKLGRLTWEELVAYLPLPKPPEGEVAASAKAETASDLPPGIAWRRVEVAPGLELMVRADAGPMLARMAREIVAQYGMGERRVD